MRHNPRRRALRHIIALLSALPLVLTRYFREDVKHRYHLTWLDNMTQQGCAYIGDFAFALTGTLAAGMEGMDLLGCIVIGFVTAMGGGTVRDILLGRYPIFWLIACDEFALCIVVSLFTFFIWPEVSMRFSLTASGEWLFWFDTLGIGAFAASGAALAVEQEGHLHILSCAFCGMCSATFGGLTRDVLLGRPPRILYPMLEIYAAPAFIGGLSTTIYLRWSEHETKAAEAIMCGLWITVHLRVLAVNHGIRLFTFPAEAVYSKEARPRCIAAEIAAEEDRARLEESYLPPERRATVMAARRATLSNLPGTGVPMTGRGSIFGAAATLDPGRIQVRDGTVSFQSEAVSSFCSESTLELGTVIKKNSSS